MIKNWKNNLNKREKMRNRKKNNSNYLFTMRDVVREILWNKENNSQKKNSNSWMMISRKIKAF